LKQLAAVAFNKVPVKLDYSAYTGVHCSMKMARFDSTRHVRLYRASRAMLFQHGGRRTSCVGLVFACTSFVERVERDECVEPCLFQHGGRRRSSSACVY